MLEEYPIVIDMPVAWGQMDAFGHVNNTVYFRYFEDARIEYLERIKFLRQEGDASDIGPILAHTECRFKLPVTFPDQLKIGARIVEMSDDKFKMEYALWSQQAQRIAAEGTGLVMSYDYVNNKRADIPDVIRQRINKLECRSC